MKLQRSISPTALLLSAIGGIVGSGWLFGPLYTAQLAGPAAIVSWFIGGVLMMIIALTFAELSTAFPVAGAMIQFAEYSHGTLLSFTMGWMVWLSSVVVAPVETLALIQYAANYLPGLVHKVNDANVLTSTGIAFAAILMLLLCMLNLQGNKLYNKLSSILVIFKFAVPILSLIILLSRDFHWNNFFIVGGFAPYGWQGIFAALPLGGIIFSFIGYSPAIQLAGEAKNPQRAIPLAIIGSLLLCSILYCLLQTAFVGALTPASLQQGWQKLSFAGDSGPFAGIFAGLGLLWFVWIIYADALISPYGTAFIYTASTARVNYALSKTGFFPAYFQHVNAKGMPTRSLFLNYFVGLILFLPFPSWQNMVGFIVSCFLISFSIGPLALVTLRQNHPNHPGAFRLPWVKPTTLLAFYICNLLVYWTGWNTVYHLLIALAIGFAVYFYHHYKSQDKTVEQNKNYLRSAWLVIYLIGLGVISYFGAYDGGRNIIKFGPDFIVVAIFSVIIYELARRSARKEFDSTLLTAQANNKN